MYVRASCKDRRYTRIRERVEYVYDERKTEDKFCHMLGVSRDNAYHDMLLVKTLFGKTEGRQYMHWVLSHDEGLPVELADKIGKEVLFLLQGKYQAVAATHLNTTHVHTHFLINSVDVVTGKKFSDSRKNMLEFREKINDILKIHGLNLIGEVQELSEEQLDFEDGSYNVSTVSESELYDGKADLIGEEFLMPGVMYVQDDLAKQEETRTLVRGVYYDDSSERNYFETCIEMSQKEFVGRGYIDYKGEIFFPGVLYQRKEIE